MLGLAKFRNRTLYANIVNEKAVTFYTAAISKVDPFYGKPKTCFNYLPGFEPVVVDHMDFFVKHNEKEDSTSSTARNIRIAWCLLSDVVSFIIKIPLFVGFAIFVSISTIGYLVNAGFQTILSLNRIKLHEKDYLYDGPLIVGDIGQDVQGTTTKMCEDIHTTTEPLSVIDENLSAPGATKGEKDLKPQDRNPALLKGSSSQDSVSALTGTDFDTQPPPRPPPSHVEREDHPTLQLALTPTQFQIINDLNSLDFHKFPVYINKTIHSHRSMIFRDPVAKYDEGRVVIRHWIEREFDLE